MRRKIILLVIMVFSNYLLSQTEIHNISEPIGKRVAGTYYKDVDSLLNNYEGTWFYSTTNTDGTITSLKIKFRKVEMRGFNSSINGLFYDDALIGVYQYIDHGIVKFDNLTTLYDDIEYWRFNIRGNRFIGNNGAPFCTECLPNEKRLKLLYTEGDRPEIMSSISMRRSTNASGQQIIIARVWQVNNIITVDDVEPLYTSMTIPFGQYTLVKE